MPSDLLEGMRRNPAHAHGFPVCPGDIDAKAAGRYLHYIRGLIKAKVLILDDLGLRNYSHEEATSLMDILEERYHKAPLIVTSQVEPQGWLKLFEDPVIAEAIVDRLIHPCQKITLKGEKSYREKLSEKKSGLKN